LEHKVKQATINFRHSKPNHDPRPVNLQTKAEPIREPFKNLPLHGLIRQADKIPAVIIAALAKLPLALAPAKKPNPSHLGFLRIAALALLNILIELFTFVDFDV
jgi:hypothetical protein